MKKILTVFLILAFMPLIIHAGTVGKLKGRVTDKTTGDPLIGANVFVIGTGRCGTKTFYVACRSGITNYTSSHESGSFKNNKFFAGQGIGYQNNHIEVDSILSFVAPKLIVEAEGDIECALRNLKKRRNCSKL